MIGIDNQIAGQLPDVESNLLHNYVCLLNPLSYRRLSRRRPSYAQWVGKREKNSLWVTDIPCICPVSRAGLCEQASACAIMLSPSCRNVAVRGYPVLSPPLPSDTWKTCLIRFEAGDPSPIFVTCVGTMEESAEEGFPVTQEDFPLYEKVRRRLGKGAFAKVYRWVDTSAKTW